MASEKENFSLTGPSHLTSVDWSNSHHRRSIAASLIQGVYGLEKDRQENRQGPQSLAPPWWEFFNYRLVKILIDDHDLSYFGALYESNSGPSPSPSPSPNHTAASAPRYVIAFRGTINNSSTRAEDLKLNLHCFVNNLQESRRFQIGLGSARDVVARNDGPYASDVSSVWLTGHSVGSSIALLIGRYMVKNANARIESYLFNPPFASPPIDKIKNEKVRLGLRLAGSAVTAGLALAAQATKHHGPSKKADEGDAFAALSSWIPYLFLNESDVVCSEYIAYFEHREKMESIGAGKIAKIATKHSIGGIVSGLRGKESDASHLIPSAYLTINSGPGKGFKEAHGIHQWWKVDVDFKYKLYQYK